MKISIIIPVLNEAKNLAVLLPLLKTLEGPCEIIVVDGYSSDDSKQVALQYADHIINAGPGRAVQMNHGASIASGEVLWFVHADTRNIAHATCAIRHVMQAGEGWGYFNICLSGGSLIYRIIAFMMNMRSWVSGIATGDQAIFVQRKLFDSENGYPNILLMEDVAISKQLRKRHKPFCIRKKIITSSRRWEKNGIIKTIIQMWYLRLVYFLGVSPAKLARYYNK